METGTIFKFHNDLDTDQIKDMLLNHWIRISQRK